MRRRLDAAGYRGDQDPAADGRAAVGAVRATGASIARTCSSCPTRSRRPRTTRRSCRGDAELMALKPMNCPAHILVFKQGIKSYRDLPVRFAEFGCCHRNEPHGALHGILRVRQFTQDDAHIFVHARTSWSTRSSPSATCSTASTRTSASTNMRSSSRCGRTSASARDEMWDWSEQSAARRRRRDRPQHRGISAGRSCRAKAPSMRPSSNGI